MADATGSRLSVPRVTAALAAILILAIALPYLAVVTLHRTRLARADRDMTAITAWLAGALPGSASLSGTTVFDGPGARPPAADERWNTAPAIPLARLTPSGVTSLPSDPWGNAYLVLISQRQNGAASRVLSAGPNGILETPFAADPPAAAGDDRLSASRPIAGPVR